MPRKSPLKSKSMPKQDNPEEYKRFLDTACDAEASDDPKDFKRAFDKIASKGTALKRPKE